MIRWCDACPSGAQSGALYSVGRIWLCCDHLDQVRAGADEPRATDSWSIRARLKQVEDVQSASRDAHAELTRKLVDVLEAEKVQRADALHRRERREGNLVFEATGWHPLMDGEYSFVGARRVDHGAPTYWLAVWQLVRRGKRSKVSVDLIGGEPPPVVTATVRQMYTVKESEQ